MSAKVQGRGARSEGFSALSTLYWFSSGGLRSKRKYTKARKW